MWKLLFFKRESTTEGPLKSGLGKYIELEKILNKYLPKINYEHVVRIAYVGRTKSSMELVVKLVGRNVSPTKWFRKQRIWLYFDIPPKMSRFWNSKITLLHCTLWAFMNFIPVIKQLNQMKCSNFVLGLKKRRKLSFENFAYFWG